MKNINFNRKKSRFFKKYKLILLAIALLILPAILIAISSTSSVVRHAFPQLTSLKSNDGRVNILLLGNAGGTHAGPFLTDTIMVASINLKLKKVDFISLPRDFWVDKLKIKLNAVYEVGQSRGSGLDLDKEIVGDILGLPLHYGLRIDFSGFEKAIDQVGGIEVEVERSFDDFNYPIAGKEEDLCGFSEEEKEFNEEEAKKLNIAPGKQKVLIAADGKIATDSAEADKGFEYFKCRFEHIHFDRGLQHMNGKMALKFVRSRMGTQGEGSDFARSKRQQKVIEATKKKVLSLETVINPRRIAELLSTFGKSIETDISVDDIIELFSLSKKLETKSNFVLDDKTLLIRPKTQDFGGAYVLVPKSGNYDLIHEYVKKVLSGEININESTGSARVGD